MHSHIPFIMGMANPYELPHQTFVWTTVYPSRLPNQRQRRKLARQTNNFKRK